MKFKKFNDESKVRENLILALHRNKITKKTIEKKLGISYPTVLHKLDRPYAFKVSELLKICSLIEDISLEELLIKY